MGTLTNNALSIKPRQSLRQSRIGLLNSCERVGSVISSEELSSRLNAYLEYLESELCSSDVSANIGQTQEMLLEVVSVVLSGKLNAREAEFTDFVSGLVAIYRNGIEHDGQYGFLLTVEDYAEVIEAVSRVFPNHDYEEALQQIFLYAYQLFERREKDWVHVYSHILSMPESIELVKMMKQKCFLDIAQEVDGGAGNLFQIRCNFAAATRKLHMKECLLEQQIARLGRLFSETDRAGNVISLKQAKRAAALSVLRQKYLDAHEAKLEKESLLQLIDLNIQELKDLMAIARRALFMRLVPELAAINSPQPQNRSISSHSIPASSGNLPSVIRSS